MVYVFLSCRFLHWTVTDLGTNELFRLDLQDNTSLVSLLQSLRRRRDVSNALVPTSALTQDPKTSRIWLSDQLSGDIFSCATTPTMSDCQTEVDASVLGNGAAGESLCVFDEIMLIFDSFMITTPLSPSFFLFSKGLPAESIVLDERRVYWSTKNNSSLVFYVLRGDPSSLGILTSSIPGSVILTLSPGQQPLPPAGNEWYSTYSIIGHVMLNIVQAMQWIIILHVYSVHVSAIMK